MLVIYIALGVVGGLWAWGALQRWASPRPPVPESFLGQDTKHH